MTRWRREGHNAGVLRTSDFDYDLPEELIAQQPAERGATRLLVLHRQAGELELRAFPDIREYVRPGDVLVLNDTRVTARRYRGTIAGGRRAEALLLRTVGDDCWEALVYPGKRLRPGDRLLLDAGDLGMVEATVVDRTSGGGRMLRFANAETREALRSRGVMPLPPYIRQPLADEERYQTVYASHGGSAAAPTAGLHFTEEILEDIRRAGAAIARVTLHVGVDTFRPVREEDPSLHAMHGERYSISPEAAEIINSRRGRLWAIGTTAVRTLESAADAQGRVRPGSEVTRLFILPGYRFRVVEVMLTNFHLPRSTLLMLVCAFAGYESIMKAYRHAVEQRLRFYSFGDAMLIL